MGEVAFSRVLAGLGVALLAASCGGGSGASSTVDRGAPVYDAAAYDFDVTPWQFEAGAWFDATGYYLVDGSYYPKCQEFCQDRNVAWAVSSTVWLLFNQDVAAKPMGPQDFAVECPLGGTVHVTGTTAVSADKVHTLHLVFDMTDCANSGLTFGLTYTGVVSLDGTFSNTATSVFTDATFSTLSLAVSGTIKFADDPTIQETCPLDETENDSQGSYSYSGKICGRQFGWTTGGSKDGGGDDSGGSNKWDGDYTCTITTKTPAGTITGPGTLHCGGGSCSDDALTFSGKLDGDNFTGQSTVCQGCDPLNVKGTFAAGSFTIDGQNTSGSVTQHLECSKI